MIRHHLTRPFGKELPARLRRLGPDDQGMSTVEYSTVRQVIPLASRGIGDGMHNRGTALRAGRTACDLR
jgi:hypothetical protein